MPSLHLPRQHSFFTGSAGFVFIFLILGFLTLLFYCLVRLFSSQFTVTLVLSVAVYIFFVYSKSCYKNSSGRIPRFSNLQVLRCAYDLLKHRNIARIRALEMGCGVCLYYSKEGMFSFAVGTRKCLFVYNPDTVETVLSSNTILQKGFPYEMVKAVMKEGLITSSGNKWHSRRKLLTPAFHFKILQEFIPVFNKHAKRFVKKIEDFMETDESLDIMPLARLCTMDIILETSMGKRMNSQLQVNEYVEALNTWSECLVRRVLFPLLWPDFIFYRTKIGKTSLENLNVLARFTEQVISDRLLERSKGKNDAEINGCPSSKDDIGRKTKQQLALLDLLLDLHMKDNKNLSLQDIADEVDTFVFAGHDTTAAAISWTLYSLGLHQDIQRNVQEELDMILGHDSSRMITSQDIRNLKYLTSVLKESLRLYPPVPIVTRNVNEDTFMINGYKISKGTTVIIPIYMLHRNPAMYSNPEEFNPERFSLENSNKRHPFAYVPFSAGPRNCIGQKFAINEVMIVLGTVLRHFHVSSVEHPDRIKIIGDLVLTSENGLHLKFTERQSVGNYSV